MKTLSSILALLAVSWTAIALPHGDKKRAVHVEQEDLRAAIELISKYEYGGGGYPGPYLPQPIQEYTVKRSPLKKEDEDSLRAAIELISSYEYQGQPGPGPGPFLPPPRQGSVKHVVPRDGLPVDDKESLRAAIELISKYEYDGRPVPPLPHKPFPGKLGHGYNIPRSLPEPDKESLRAAIELISKYEYKDNPYPAPDPIKPIPIQTLKPIPLPTIKPDPRPSYDPAPYKPRIGKRKEAEYVDDYSGDEKESLRAAIELLSKYEYKDVPIPYIPIPTIKPIPIPIPIPIPTYKLEPIPSYKPSPTPTYKPAPGPYRPPSVYEPQPYKPQYEKRSEPYTKEDKEESLRAAIELITKYEYKPVPIPFPKPTPIIKPIPIPTLKPAPIPIYDPAPYKPQIGKRENRVQSDEEAGLRAAIELISKAEYGGGLPGKKKPLPILLPAPESNIQRDVGKDVKKAKA